MRNLLNPKWLLLLNTLPITVLYFLLSNQFNIIKTLLDESSVQLWKTFGTTLAVLAILNLSYTVFLIFKRQSISIWYSIAALALYIPFIYLYAYHLDQIIPFSIPRWMISDNLFLYVGTFLMPTIAYSLFTLVTYSTRNKKENKGWINFLVALAIPVSGYLFTQIILPLAKGLEGEFFIHANVVLTIVATLVFLFFLIRGIFILVTRKEADFQKYQLAWKIPIAIVFPILGLAINDGHLLNSFGSGSSGIFGDFNNPLFYIIALVNGILVCLPNLNNKVYRLLLFSCRSITFAYTLYFFLVFLPFLPLAIIAIIAIGTGFLMLTPLLLFIIHVNELSMDFAYLKNFFPKKIIGVIIVLGFLLIPVLINVSYLRDKKVLNETLDYIYNPNYSADYHIDCASLQKTLDVIKGHKDRRSGLFRDGIPYLSTYFNWLVLNNLTLSDSKINTIEQIFFDHSPYNLRPENIQKHDVEISRISSNSEYDKSQNAWKSWVDLEISNKSENDWFSEYATTIHLPEGCWISDYYLFVGDKKEPGILAEKKSAMWIFSQIRSENRDPGILYYLTGNKVAFRVFPFAKDEVRKTGIEFLHKEPVKLNFDGHIIELGNDAETENETIKTENITYVSSRQKQSLKSVKRDPYFHFLVDVSKGKNTKLDDFTSRINKVVKANQPLSANAKISFVNSYVKTTQLQGDWRKQYQSQKFEGGFYLDRAIKLALIDAPKSKSYPVIVVVTDTLQYAVLDKDFSDFEFTFPESPLFFAIDNDGDLCEHSLIGNPKEPLPQTFRECMFCETVLEYKLSDNTTTYLPNNDKPSIILKNDLFNVSENEIQPKNWLSALKQQGKYRSHIIHPETSDATWLDLVKYSFISKIMTPVTSYLVVENEAQKAMLKKKQEQILSGNKSLDPSEDTQRMSEPSLIVLTFVLGLILWFREKRKRNLKD